MKRAVLLLLLISPACLWAYDFSLTLPQDSAYGGFGNNTELEHTGGIIPCFSTSVGKSGDLYISAWFKIAYEYEKTFFIGEFLNAEFSWSIKNIKIKSGSIPYAAPLDYITEDFFNGIQASFDTNIGTFNAGGWENPDIAGMIRAKAVLPVKQFIISMGGCLQTAKADEQTEIGLTGELGGSWIMPTAFLSQLSLLGRYVSGRTDNIYPFVPVNAKPYGNMMQAKLSGISSLLLDYSAKLHPTVSAGLSASYFIRNDKEANTVYPVNPVDSGSALGSELFGRAVWNPFTDFSVNIGAGFFIPSSDNMIFKTSDAQWRVELGFSLIVY